MFLIYSLGSGGAERVLLDTVNHLNQEKYEITLQTLFDEKAFSNQLGRYSIQNGVFRKKNSAKKNTEWICTVFDAGFLGIPSFF